MQTENQNKQSKITFKPASGSYQPYIHPYVPKQTIDQIKSAIMSHYGVQYEQVKLISKGKVLEDKLTVQEANIQGKVVMLVINKKVQKKKESVDNTIKQIPNSFNTGMGSTSPVGFGGYGMINHPQYMSAMSGAVNQENLEDMMNDPTYQGMMQDMMNDPDTLKQLLEDNPMFKNMMKQNPSLKMIMDNPALMKMVFNKDTMKMASEMMKKGNNGEGGMPNVGQTQNPNPQSNFAGMPQMPNLGMFGQQFNNPSSANNSNPMPNSQFGQNPFGFGPFGMGMGNPFMMNMFNPQTNNNQSQSVQQASQSIQQKYKSQLKQLESMGFTDRQQNIKALIESKGDVDGAIQRLCKD